MIYLILTQPFRPTIARANNFFTTVDELEQLVEYEMDYNGVPQSLPELDELGLPELIMVGTEVRTRENIMNNATFDARHLGGHAWGVNHYEVRRGDSWITAFSLQPSSQSISPNETVAGWLDNAEAWQNLTAAQRSTIELILKFGYGNFYGVAGSVTNDDSIITTQVAIWEVVIGLWDINTPWDGWSERINPESVFWYFNERLIRESGIASGSDMFYYNPFDNQIHNHTLPIGNQNRVNRYNRLRLDINHFGRLNLRPQFTHVTPEIAREESNLHQLTWNTIRNRYEVTLSDSEPMGGNQVLNRYLSLQIAANSSWLRLDFELSVLVQMQSVYMPQIQVIHHLVNTHLPQIFYD